jgi:transcriptional regulator with GAF, ATPase, and Fis domain
MAVGPAGTEATDNGVDSSLVTVQRDHILRTLEVTGWVIEGARGAAARLGMKPATLRFRMKKFGIRRMSGESH